MSTARTKQTRRERLDEAEAIILCSGHKTVSAALRKVDLDRMTYLRSVGDGLTDNPRDKTIRKLRKLGVLEIARRPL